MFLLFLIKLCFKFFNIAQLSLLVYEACFFEATLELRLLFFWVLEECILHFGFCFCFCCADVCV